MNPTLILSCHAGGDPSRRAREERDHRLQAEAGYDLEREVADLVVGDQVKEVMATLPDGERRAIELASFGGYTHREVATMLDEPEGTVRPGGRPATARWKIPPNTVSAAV